MQDAAQVLKEVKSGKVAPVYFFCGEEFFYVDEVVRYLEHEFLPKAERDLALQVLYGKEVKAQDIIARARSFPFMAQRQVIIVKEAQEVSDLFPKTSPKDPGPAEKAVLAYLENPQPSTILVFVFRKAPDKRKRLFKAFEKSAITASTKALYEDKVPFWVNDYVKEKGYKIDPEAQILLVEYAGVKLGNLANQLSKIFLNLEKGDTITKKTIQSQIGVSAEYNPWQLQNAVAEKNLEKSLRIIDYLAADENKYPAHLCTGALYQYFTKVLVTLNAGSMNERELAALLSVHPFFMKDFKKSARLFSKNKTLHIMNMIRDTELKAKGMGGGDTPKYSYLKELVMKIIYL